MVRVYQYANRLAHLYFLREVIDIDAHPVFLYFLNDEEKNRPRTRAEWESALLVLHEALGMRRRLQEGCVHDIFVDVRELVPAHAGG